MIASTLNIVFLSM